MDPKEYAIIIKNIADNLNISPNETLIMNVSQFIRKRDIPNIRKRYKTNEEFYDSLINSYMLHISKDYLVKEEKMIEDQQKSLHKKPESKKNRSSVIGPLAQWIDRSMHIDINSLFRDISNDLNSLTVSQFRFILSSRNDRLIMGTGLIPSRIIPNNITYMKIGKINMFYSSTLANLNTHQEITLTFTGIRNNGSIITARNSNETIHFSFTYIRSTIDTRIIEMTPVNKYCKFDPPLTYLDNLSLQWNDPTYPIPFDTDRFYPVSFNYAQANGRINMPDNHGLVINDVIIINGLTTLNDAANSVILSQINNVRGLRITHVAGNEIWTGLSFNTIITPDTSSLPLILIPYRSFRIPLEIGYQESDELA